MLYIPKPLNKINVPLHILICHRAGHKDVYITMSMSTTFECQASHLPGVLAYSSLLLEVRKDSLNDLTGVACDSNSYPHSNLYSYSNMRFLMWAGGWRVFPVINM